MISPRLLRKFKAGWAETQLATPPGGWKTAPNGEREETMRYEAVRKKLEAYCDEVSTALSMAGLDPEDAEGPFSGAIRAATRERLNKAQAELIHEFNGFTYELEGMFDAVQAMIQDSRK